MSKVRNEGEMSTVAVEAVDRPKSGGDELVSGVTMPKNLQQEPAQTIIPVQAVQQEGTYDFVYCYN